MSDIKINIHKCEAPETGYWAEIPTMPGCVTCADTLEGLKKNLIEAAQCWIGMETQIALVPHHGNRVLPQGTLNAIFNQTGIPKPKR